MMKLKNLRNQIVILEKKVNGKPVSFRIPAKGEAFIHNEEMTQDILIKSERGDVRITAAQI